MNSGNSRSTYKVVMLFNGEKYSVEGLEEMVREELESHNHGDISVHAKSRESSEHINLTIQGSKKEAADSYKELFNNEDFKGDFITLVDEPGDEYRSQGYKKVSNLEQSLRALLQQVLTDYFDFDWWEKSAPEKIREKERKEYRASHPLERFTFEVLIKIVEKPKWSKDEQLTRGELLDLVSSNHSIEDLKEKLKAKMEETFSDKILPNYLGEGDTWEDLRNMVKKVIEFRNRIMHHRPFWSYEFDDLEDLSTDIRGILENVSPPTKQETERIAEEHEELVSETGNIIEKNINEQIVLETEPTMSTEGMAGAIPAEGDIKIGGEPLQGKIMLEEDKITIEDIRPNLGDFGIGENIKIGDTKFKLGEEEANNTTEEEE